ncbi:dockerin type I domain-containing protein [Porcipelethomonas sp.]|uniref:dockerin type I domain-containing protein n=1 Tax=Porcipelethomonas sp. TaxID=2981675 RepID=UPI003EF86E37
MKKLTILLSAIIAVSFGSLPIYAAEEVTAQDSQNNIEEDIVLSDEEYKPGDPAGEFIFNIRDAAYIARLLARGEKPEYSEHYDVNGDGVVNIRDAAAIARNLAIK